MDESIASFDARVVAGPMTWSYALGECRELGAEIRALNWGGIVDEASDSALCLQLALYHQLGGRVDWPLLLGRRSARKFEARLQVWLEIFAREGLQFHKRYLIGGGNYARPEKVEAALRLARAEQL